MNWVSIFDFENWKNEMKREKERKKSERLNAAICEWMGRERLVNSNQQIIVITAHSDQRIRQ